MLTITPNRRLAAFSIRLANEQQLANRQLAWETPQIYSLEAWLLQLWQLCCETFPQTNKTLLNTTQQQILLERIIQQSTVGVELLRAAATAKNVLQAWRFLRQWQVPDKVVAAYADFAADTAVFYAWIQDYLKWLENNNYIDFDQMVEQLLSLLPKLYAKLATSTQNTTIPNTICLRGMQDLAPQYAALFAQLAACGVEIIHDQIIQPGANVVRTKLANITGELQAAAEWALQIVEADPKQIIGVVVPDLSAQRKQVESVFAAILPRAYLNISAPLPLAQFPLLDSALLLLQMAKPCVDFSDFSILLRSPFIISADLEMHNRACLDRRLRTEVEAKVTWTRILNSLQSEDQILANCIGNFMRLCSTSTGLHTTQHWLQHMQELLACWGWPGKTTLSIEESDLLTCWHDLLAEYSKLGPILPLHSYSEALQIIQRLANETPFAPAETGLTRVHVLGVLEADGLAFDHLWVTGMDRDSWPQIADPNPFIPLELQRKYDLPKSSPQREFKVAQRLTTNLMQGGKQQVIFSYAAQIEDHAAAPSNLITHLAEQHMSLKVSVDLPIVVLQELHDPKAPPLKVYEVKGGINILKLQALCPFKANAEIRLRAIALEEPQLSLNAAHRGELVHTVLEKFWQRCTNKGQLLQHSSQDLAAILEQIVDGVLVKLQRKLPQTMSNNYVQLEAQRIHKLVARWLQYEVERDDFSVQFVEHKLQVQVGPLQFLCKIDRIDRLAEGGLVIIDYKTGLVKTADWFSQPIFDPQMPLYAVMHAEEVVAVVVAHLQADETLFKGVALSHDLLPQVKDLAGLSYAYKAENWTQQLVQWRTNLERTAHEFVHGHAAVQPHSNQVCERCNLQSLCRIYDY